jgi:hypothetical protein
MSADTSLLLGIVLPQICCSLSLPLSPNWVNNRRFEASLPVMALWHISCSISPANHKRATGSEKPHLKEITNTGTEREIKTTAPQRLCVSCAKNAPSRNSARWIAGTALIASSFLFYLAYPVILFVLPLPRTIKAGVALAVWLVSWAVFSAGILLAGPEGFDRFKGLWSRIMNGRRATALDSQQVADE